MTNRPKRKIRRRTIYQLRAFYATIASVSLVVLGATLGVLALFPSLLSAILAFLVIIGLTIVGYIVTHELLKLDYHEKRIDRDEAAKEAQQQQDDMEAATRRAVAGGITDALQDEVLISILKEAMREMIREELAHSNLADKEDESTPPADEADEDSDTDTSQQNH